MAKLDLPKIFLATIGGVSILNALWMLIGPESWYHDLPAGVEDFGPFNGHFARDIGVAFGTVGAALIWAAFDERFRFPLASIGALFYLGHALLHVFDTARGLVPPLHWLLDLGPVYLPAVALVWIAYSEYQTDHTMVSKFKGN